MIRGTNGTESPLLDELPPPLVAQKVSPSPLVSSFQKMSLPTPSRGGGRELCHYLSIHLIRIFHFYILLFLRIVFIEMINRRSLSKAYLILDHNDES